MTKKRILGLGLAAALAVGSVALAKGKGILFPDWSKPASGTFEEPSGELGTKPAAENPWSVTTMASSIKGMPVKGAAVTLVGEIVDLSCYLQVGKHGEKHRECGQKCVRNGQPVGLVTKDGTIYMLADEEHDPRRDGLTAFRQACVDHMAHVMKVNGTLTTVDGLKTVYVQGYLKQ